MKAGIFVFLLSLSIATSRVVHSRQKQNETDNGGNDKAKNQYLWQESGKFQGDMVLPKSMLERNGIPISQGKRWPGNTLVYKYGSNLSYEEKMQIYYAFLEIYEKANNCIGFREAGQNDRDYILIENKPEGCWSHIGYTGGEQKMNIQTNGCSYKGTIMHETLHSLGFFHMHSDPSRDNYVSIYWDNIEDNYRYAFDRLDDLTSFGVQYDIKSIMHYGRTAFSKNNQPTIVAKSDYNMELGGRELTASDILKMRRMYGCE